MSADEEVKDMANSTNQNNCLTSNEQVNDGQEDGEEVLTLRDMEELVEEAEEDARRLLGGQNPDVCTYPEGYKPRQALYACKTCAPEGNGGVCFGCSLKCHDGHDLVELYTKRRFKCDCGNEVFKSKCCLYDGEKAARNERNEYNHNFLNEYCNCNRPYPDPEGRTKEEMVQCVSCEDWFHPSHIGMDVKVEEVENGELVCLSCSNQLPFFQKIFDLMSANASKECLKDFVRKEGEGKAIVLPPGWREMACDCSECKDYYDRLGCDWIHDVDDSMEKYDEETKAKVKEEDEEAEKNMERFLGQQDKDVVVEVLYEVNRMKRKMNDYLRELSERGQVVTDKDVHSFFDELKRERNEERRRRLEEDAQSSSQSHTLDGEY